LTVDILDFVRLLIDWVVNADIEGSADGNTLQNKFPVTDSGSIFFFNPSNAVEPIEEILEDEDEDDENGIDETVQINNKSLEFALTEMFNFYARRYSDKYTDFD